MRRTTSILAAALLAAGSAPAPAGACDGPEHRQFDFWLGQWVVRTPDGKIAGTNRIEREYDGCVVHERYATERGYRGESLNVYDAARKVWHQTWVDNRGTLLLLDGSLQDAGMVLSGQGIDAAGKTVHHRITWTPRADGSVRQLWQTSDDRDRWTTVFDGIYTRKPADGPR